MLCIIYGLGCGINFTVRVNSHKLWKQLYAYYYLFHLQGARIKLIEHCILQKVYNLTKVVEIK